MVTLKRAFVLLVVAALLGGFFTHAHGQSDEITVRAYSTSAQTIGHNSPTAVNLNNERWDFVPAGAVGMHDNVTNNSRLTAIVSGTYVLTAHVAFAANTTGVRALAIRLNGTSTIATQITNAAGSGATFLTLSTVYRLTAGDYVEMVVTQTSGGDLSVSSAARSSPEFTMTLVGQRFITATPTITPTVTQTPTVTSTPTATPTPAHQSLVVLDEDGGAMLLSRSITYGQVGIVVAVMFVILVLVVSGLLDWSKRWLS